MRNFGIELRGINRKINSSDNDTGFCSELINLKPENGVKVVPQKKIYSVNIPFRRIKVHKIGQIINHIGIKEDSSGIEIVHFDKDTGFIIQTIASFKADSEIYYTLLNNQLVISDKTGIKEYVYKFTSSYELVCSGIDFSFNCEMTSEFTDEVYSKTIISKSKEEFISSCNGYINEFKATNKHYCEGIFLYAFTVTLIDGTETGMYNLKSVATEYNDKHPSEDGAFVNIYLYDSDKFSLSAGFLFNDFYQSHNLTIEKSEELYARYKDLIKSVNLYVSVPISRMPLTDSTFITDVEWNNSGINAGSMISKIDVTYPKDSGVENALLYKQKSWTLKEFSDGFSYKLEFGGDKQATGATMEVSQPYIERAGKMYTYNNRINFYDSIVRLNTPLGDIYNPIGSTDSVICDVYVYINTGNKDCVLKHESVKVGIKETDGTQYINLPDMLVYPDSRAYRIVFVVINGQDEYIGKIVTLKNLNPSGAYNYSYYFGGETAKNILSPQDEVIPELSNVYEETDSLNVTANGTPMVFPVKYSYKFDGNITALSVAMESLTESQVGQYPINVFTDNGVYALQQGNGDVLYASIVPISNSNCYNDNIVALKGGIAYIAHNSVWLLSGMRQTKLSEIIEGSPDIYIQNNDSYLKCCSNRLYDIAPYLSRVNFKDYITNETTLSYSPTNEELIVSNKNYNYSYVYNFIYNAWYKITGTYSFIGDNLMLRPSISNMENPTPSSATITLSAIHKEKEKSIYSLSYATYDQDIVCNSAEEIAMSIDDKQIASAVFNQPTEMNMAMATLCEKIDMLEDYKGSIYSIQDLSGKNLKVYNATTKTTILETLFTAEQKYVSIPNKAVNSILILTIQNESYSTVITDTDSISSVLQKLCDNINNNSSVVSAVTEKNKIHLTSKEKGTKANDIAISITSTDKDYVYVTTSDNIMTGGKDYSVNDVTGYQIIDWIDDKSNTQQIIHAQTRPIHLERQNGYKILRRTIANCLATIKDNENLSVYIFGSNNLSQWKCIGASQRQNCNVAQITLDRTAKAYKFFVLIIGGVVNDNTELSNIIITTEDVTEYKIR